MPELEILIALVAGAVLLVRLADLVSIPYPIVLVMAGLAVSAIPGVEGVGLTPDIILLVFLPPLLFAAAQNTSPKDLRTEMKPVAGLVIGLSAATMFAVAAAASLAVPDLDWAEALLLGAIVSPTDPLAAIATFSRVGVPERVARLVEAESLLNDATALVFYRVLVAAVISGSFAFGPAGVDFLVGIAGGVAIGLLLGAGTVFLQRRLLDSALSIVMGLAVAYGAYLLAEHLEASGVLATVAAGIYIGVRSRDVLDAETRLSGKAFWETLVFALNVILFVLLGLKFPDIISQVTSRFSVGELITWGAAVSMVVIVVRLAWQFLPPLTGRLLPWARGFDTGDGWRERLTVGWTGMRGAVSLAAALALPFTFDSGAGFDDRYLIAFITVAVIFSTLVLQGLTLPWVLRLTGLASYRPSGSEEIEARVAMAGAALNEIDLILAEHPEIPEEAVARFRTLYSSRFDRWSSLQSREDQDEERIELLRRMPGLRHRMIRAERRELQARRYRGEVSMPTFHQLQRELDLEESRVASLRPTE